MNKMSNFSESNFVVVAKNWFLISHNNFQPRLRRMIQPSVKFQKRLQINYCYITMPTSDLIEEFSNTPCDLHVGLCVCDHVPFMVLL